MKQRAVELRRLIGVKKVKEKTYEYEYYTLPLLLYIPKSMVKKYGTKYVVQIDEDSGTITIRPYGL